MPNILTPRDHFKPFEYPWAFDAYRTMRKMAWEPEEAPLHEDLYDWNHRLTEHEKNLLTQLFRFFTQGDVDVASAYRDRYMPLFKKPELSMMLYAFADSEANHIHAYSLLLDTIGMPDLEYKAFHEYKEMAAKHEYLFAKRNDSLSKIQKLALDVAVFSAFSEGMQLFSSFAILLNFQRRGLMKGMSTIVEWSIRDESHHVESMIKVFLALVEENPRMWTDDFKKEIYQTAREMVSLEDHFIDLVFAQGEIEGMSPEDVKLYIRYIADRRLNQLGLKANYGIETNPFDWLDWIVGASTHTNFFEQRSTEYSKGGLEGWEEVVWDSKYTGNVISYEVVAIRGCPWCSQARHELKSGRHRYQYKVLETEEEIQAHKTMNNFNTFPMVTALYDTGDRRFLGGYKSLKSFLDTGGLFV